MNPDIELRAARMKLLLIFLRRQATQFVIRMRQAHDTDAYFAQSLDQAHRIRPAQDGRDHAVAWPEQAIQYSQSLHRYGWVGRSGRRV